MPQYQWRCTKCHDVVECRRSIERYDQPPTEWDIQLEGKRFPNYPPCNHEWERLVSGGQIVTGLGNKGRH